MSRRRQIIGALVVVGAAVASAAAFALADESSAGEAKQVRFQTRAAASLAPLLRAAHSLDRPRTRSDVLPPGLAQLLGGLPDQAADAAASSMRVLDAPGVGSVYVAPSASGFAIVGSAGFAGTVPRGLDASNPVVGGSFVDPHGRLVVTGIAADSVVRIAVVARGRQSVAERFGNGFWWIAPDATLDPDDVAVFADVRGAGRMRVF